MYIPVVHVWQWSFVLMVKREQNLGTMWPQAVVSSEHCYFGSDDEIEPTAVLHSFGRGEFRDRTEKAKIPSVLLEQLCLQSEKSSQLSTWSGKVGVSVRSKVVEEMTCVVTRPRGRGRAHILQRRVQADCKPGGMQDKVS